MVSATSLALIPFQPATAAARETLPPARLAIYYGYPSLINGAAGDLTRAAQAFSTYDVVVFGDGLEFADQDASRLPTGAGGDEHDRASQIIARLHGLARSPELYGYVALGSSQHLTLPEIARRTGLWASMGVTGIFFDEAGHDYGVSRQRLSDAVAAAHQRQLRVCVNAFDPADVLGTDPTTPVMPLKPGDAVLLESFGVRLGVRQALNEVSARADRAAALRARTGVRLFAAPTASPDGSFRSADRAYAWWLAAAWGIDAIGWGEPQYSAADSRLPWRPPPPEEAMLRGAHFVAPLAHTPGQITRRTSAGVIVISAAGEARLVADGSSTRRRNPLRRPPA